MRLSTELNGKHHVTVPQHSALRVGTCAAILDAVASHFGITRDELLGRIAKLGGEAPAAH